MARNTTKRPGDYLTLRLHEEERELLRDLGRVRSGVGDRYTALLDLVEIVDGLELEDIRKRERRALRIKVPTPLKEAIDRRTEATGQTFLAVLIEAAREFHRRHAPRGRRNR